MDVAKKLVLNLKQNNNSHVGYGLQKECEDLIGHVLQNMIKSKLPNVVSIKKNSEDSVRFRDEGNQHFVMGEDYQAIECYTMSLAYANTKELMSYAHANRSAALYRIKLYEECLMDIDVALQLGYPEEKKKKLQERGTKAITEIKKLLALNEINLSNSELIIKESSNDNKKSQILKIEKDDKDLKVSTMSNNESNLNGNFVKNDDSSTDIKCSSSSKKAPRYLDDEGPLQLKYGPSKEAPALSDGIKIVYTEEYGRHLVATKKFEPGDVITIENPYAHVIYQERFYTHCHNCLTRCYNLIPCSSCPIAQYCSKECRKTAWNMAHKVECPIWVLFMNLLNVDKDKIRILTKIIRLLIILTNNGKNIKEIREDMNKAETNSDSRTAGFTDEKVFDSFNARCALSLATNMTTRPLIGISSFACISALASVLIATQTKFFGKKYKATELNNTAILNDLKFCGSIMFRACVIMSSNCFSVQQEPGIKSGSGLYVCHSLYNHSCAPNTFRHFEGLTMITRAQDPILPGEQVFTSYGAAYAYMTRSERKKKLMDDYFFDCKCSACVGDWPVFNDILRNHVGSITKNHSLVQKLKPFKERLLINKYDVDAVKNVLAILHQEVKQPCEEIVHAQQYLKSYYLDP